MITLFSDLSTISSSAASVGSPQISPCSFCSALVQSAAQSSSFSGSAPGLASDPPERVCPSGRKTSVTVILFSVSVPVLSEQITSAQPRVSTECSRRISAFFLSIRETASPSEIVITAVSPSGIAATERESPVRNISNAGSPRKIPVSVTTRQMIMHPAAMYLLKTPRRFCRGVCSAFVSRKSPAILPICVSIPVSVTANSP